MKKTVDPTPADPGKKDPTPTPVKKDGVISVTDKAAIKTKKAAPKSGDDNEAATYVCLLCFTGRRVLYKCANRTGIITEI